MSKHQPSGGRRVLLLALLGVAAVAGVIAWPGGAADEESTDGAAPAQSLDGTFEVQPVLMRGTIASASWRDGAADEARADDARETPPERDPLWEDAGETRRRENYERSLEETVAPIDGLGVYVAPVGSGEGSR